VRKTSATHTCTHLHTDSSDLELAVKRKKIRALGECVCFCSFSLDLLPNAIVV